MLCYARKLVIYLADKLLEIFEQIGEKLHKIKLMAVHRLSQRKKNTLANITGRSAMKLNHQKGGNKGSKQNTYFFPAIFSTVSLHFCVS